MKINIKSPMTWVKIAVSCTFVFTFSYTVNDFTTAPHLDDAEITIILPEDYGDEYKITYSEDADTVYIESVYEMRFYKPKHEKGLRK